MLKYQLHSTSHKREKDFVTFSTKLGKSTYQYFLSLYMILNSSIFLCLELPTSSWNAEKGNKVQCQPACKTNTRVSNNRLCVWTVSIATVQFSTTLESLPPEIQTENVTEFRGTRCKILWPFSESTTELILVRSNPFYKFSPIFENECSLQFFYEFLLVKCARQIAFVSQHQDWDALQLRFVEQVVKFVSRSLDLLVVRRIHHVPAGGAFQREQLDKPESPGEVLMCTTRSLVPFLGVKQEGTYIEEAQFPRVLQIQAPRKLLKYSLKREACARSDRIPRKHWPQETANGFCCRPTAPPKLVCFTSATPLHFSGLSWTSAQQTWPNTTRRGGVA